MSDLKYAGYDIVFQEVPNEISLAINITNCPHKCKGCHSSYLADDFGNFVHDDLQNIIDFYKGLITCVCFMGGDQNIYDLKKLLLVVKSNGLKTCVYSGSDESDIFDDVIYLIDYLKIGPYVEELGGLNSSTTNQRMYEVKFIENKYELINITYCFQAKKI